jgi:hypothetical protein
MRKLWHDPGSEFNNKLFAEYLKSNDLTEIQTPTAWKQVNGLIERAIGTAAEQLNCLRKDDGVPPEGPWVAYLAQVEGAYNTKIHDGTLVEPCRILRGSGEDRAIAIAIAKEQIGKLRRKVSKFTIVYEVGDFILVRAEEKKKIQGPMDRWLGPYKIVSCNSILVTYAEGSKLIEKPYSKVTRYIHERDSRPGAVLLLGPIKIIARSGNSVTCRIGEADSYVYDVYEDD